MRNQYKGFIRRKNGMNIFRSLEPAGSAGGWVNQEFSSLELGSNVFSLFSTQTFGRRMNHWGIWQTGRTQPYAFNARASKSPAARWFTSFARAILA